MKLSTTHLKELQAPPELLEILTEDFSDQDFDCQAVLELLAGRDKTVIARWLIENLPNCGDEGITVFPDLENLRSSRHFVAIGNATINGDLEINGDVICGGELSVDSNLIANSVFAKGSINVTHNVRVGDEVISGGKITVGGDLRARNITAGFSIDVDGSINGKTIASGTKAASYFDALSCLYDFDHPQAEDIQRAVEVILAANCGVKSPFSLAYAAQSPFGIRAKKGLRARNIDCTGRIDSGGELIVLENLETTMSIKAKGDVKVYGNLSSRLGIEA